MEEDYLRGRERGRKGEPAINPHDFAYRPPGSHFNVSNYSANQSSPEMAGSLWLANVNKLKVDNVHIAKCIFCCFTCKVYVIDPDKNYREGKHFK